MKWLYVLLTFVPVFSQDVSYRTNSVASPCTDENHLFLAPGVLAAGGNSRACVSRFHAEGPARMLVTLVTDDEQTVTAYRELPPGDGGCIDISVPQRPNTKAKLTVNLGYPEAQCSWERSLTVRVSSGKVMAVHTERARYRPGDTLRARLVVLKADLAPTHGVIDEIWLEGPRGAWEGARAAQWHDVRTRMGLAQIQYDLDELAPPGRWTIRARLGDGTMASAGFWVGNYELAPFQLSVRHAARVLRTSERLVWTVCVRYPWTEAVEGMLVIRIRGAGGTSISHEPSGGIRTVVRIKAPRACHRHAAASRRIGLSGPNPPDVVVADFSFQEDGTRIWQNTTVVSQVVDKPVSLEFLTKYRTVISPGLPYKLKIKATRWDDKPAANEHVRVCRSPSHTYLPPPATYSAPSHTNTFCLEATTDDWGVAKVTFTSSDDTSPYYQFQATLYNDSSVSAPPLHIANRRVGSVHAALGPIRPDTESGKTFVPLYISLANVTYPLTVHFVVITRGGIIYRWGATTQCPMTSSSDYIPTTSRNSLCYNPHAANLDTKIERNFDAPEFYTNHPNYNINILNYGANDVKDDVDVFKFDSDKGKYDVNSSKVKLNDTNDPDSLLDRHLLRVMLPIKVTHQMCPDSHLIAYFYYNGELISASKHFEMDECFNNKVEATWLSRQVAPGSIASLLVTTPGPALCALSVLDSAARWNQPSTTVKDVLMSGLRRLIDSHRNLTEYDAAGACFLTSDEPELQTNSLELMAIWLSSAGVRVAGGGLAGSTRCVTAPAPLMDDATVPRTDFSEAWLWRLAGIGPNGTAVVSGKAPDSISRFEASAVCLSRSGIAISQPAVLQVFREFFIHADSPKRLRRGDATIVRYRIFNYLYEPLSVQIQILTDAHLEGPVEPVEAACVGGRASIARRAEVRATVAGDARLSIRAKAVQDKSCANTTTRASVSDEVIIEITVDPEGVPQQEHKSILLCGRGSPESSRSEVSWSWPPVQAVPGTEALTVWAAGNITGPLLTDADALVSLPRGCGEQNMARLATNLLALSLLPPNSPAAATAREHVARGFTRQLQYVHPTGGFSAFGAADAAPSTWLTAFSLRYLRRAHQVLTPGLPMPPALERAERWLLGQQMENGCFRNEGQVFHRELKGGLTEDGEAASVALTAYVITSLVESSGPLPVRALRSTLSCLRALPPLKARAPTRVYAHALLGHALMRIRAYEDELRKTNEASLLWERREAVGAGLKEDEELRELMELLKLAKRTEDYVWWETNSLPTTIESTGYALRALALCPARLAGACAHDARAAARWLAAHLTAQGGFLSTQDTLVALEALTAWSSVQPQTPPDLTVRVRSGSDSKSSNILPGARIPEVFRMGAGDQLDVSVEGTGCALIQATRSYNSLSSDLPRDKTLTVQVSVHTDGPFDCDVNGTSCFCAAVVEACVVWTGAFPEMALLEVWLPASASADAGRLYSQLRPSDPLLRRIELTPSGSRATLYLSAGAGFPGIGGVAGGAGVSGGGHACYSVHAVGPRARSRPAHVRVIDYYTPTINHTQLYTIPEDCPPRIIHESNEYLASDNLFNKAKSLSDDSGIVITHEFSFEDIPEGLPLEDPLYETFNGDEIAYLSKRNELKPGNLLENTVNSTVNVNTLSTVTVSTIKTDRDEDNEKEAHLNNDEKSPSKLNERNVEEIGNNNKSDQITNMKTNLPENSIKLDDGDKFEKNVEINKPTQNIKDIGSTNEKVAVSAGSNMAVSNPKLSEFHVIDSEKDLEVPTGIEGPVPSIVLPPQNFAIAAPPPEFQPYYPMSNYQRRSFPYHHNQHFVPYNRRYYRNLMRQRSSAG